MAKDEEIQTGPHAMMGYDRTSTVFAPDGRLLQVEYAKKAVEKGAMTLGIICKDGVVLVADRRINEKLLVLESIKKIEIVDEHIISTFSGLTSDARVLTKKCRVYAQQNKLTYGEEIDVESVVKYVTDLSQSFTQYGGIRPFGICFLFAGADKKGLQLYVTEPSGIYAKYYAKAIGSGSTEATKILDKKYKDNLSVEEGLKLAISIFQEVLDKEFSIERLEALAVTEKGIQPLKIQ